MKINTPTPQLIADAKVKGLIFYSPFGNIYRTPGQISWMLNQGKFQPSQWCTLTPKEYLQIAQRQRKELTTELHRLDRAIAGFTSKGKIFQIS